MSSVEQELGEVKGDIRGLRELVAHGFDSQRRISEQQVGTLKEHVTDQFRVVSLRLDDHNGKIARNKSDIDEFKKLRWHVLRIAGYISFIGGLVYLSVTTYLRYW